MTQQTDSRSESDWIARAKGVLPAGGFGNYDPSVLIERGEAGRVWDVDGKEYVDFILGSGPMLVGHGHPEVREVLAEQLDRGLTFFAGNPQGIELAEVICEAVACADQLRFVSTGSEADMYAMRLARAYTGRDKILKFEGGYHGMSSEALMSMGPTRLDNFPQPIPDTAGVPAAVRDTMIVAPFNDADFARDLMAQYADELAAVIVEPFQRLIPPVDGFLEALRKETERHGIVLIFDEVVTGFRLAYGGAQELYGVIPDLCTLGKAIGGGFPLAAIAGRREIMNHFDKDIVGEKGFTFQVGTLSGNPMAATAGLKTLEILRRPGAYKQMEATGRQIMAAMSDSFGDAGIAHQVVGHPILFDIMFSDQPVLDHRGVLACDAEALNRFNSVMRRSGILKGPSKFYISLAHDEADVAVTTDAIATAAREMAQAA